MKKENVLPSNFRHLNGPITRAAALRASGTMPPLKASTKQDRKRNLRTNLKRAALDENSTSRPDNQWKRRAVLRDVTNVCCENSYTSCFSATKIQAKVAKQAKRVQLDESKVKREPYSEVVSSTTSEKDVPSQPSGTGEFSTDDPLLPNLCSIVPFHPHHSPKKAEKCSVSENWKASSDPEFIDIDSDHKEPQLCSLYAADIYSNLRVAELARRSLPTFMETVQQDITQIMRGILVDWLVEVSEEYKLVPDTLYLTVHLIDWFLSQNYIDRHRLQLLGITCMLIASKYEEICSPHVEEFCFITDNTYTSIEKNDSADVKFETGFQNDQTIMQNLFIIRAVMFMVSVLTPQSGAGVKDGDSSVKFFWLSDNCSHRKNFSELLLQVFALRRFLRAAQASYRNPRYELKYLADYLAELTLVDYSFLKFLPSVIAASSVFLARWTLDRTNHPWSPTLEHYTSYKASDLKTTVLALQGLQLNTGGCPLNAIRMKYRQPKFKSVAALSSPKLLETLF